MSSDPILRRLRRDDAEHVLTGFFADPEMKHQGDVEDRESAVAYIEFLTDAAAGNHGFAIDLGERCVGVVGINGASRHRLGWFFYWLHPDFRGRGLTSRAAAGVATWALNEEPSGGGFDRLELGHRASNPASGGVAHAAGFIQEGTERKKFLIDGERIDVHTYGRLNTDPLPSTPPLAIKH